MPVYLKQVKIGKDLKNRVVKEQADHMRSYLNRPIYKRGNSNYQGASDRSYDFIVIRSNALLACADPCTQSGY